MRRMRRRPQVPTTRTSRTQRRPRSRPTQLPATQNDSESRNDSNRGNGNRRSRSLRLPKWFDPNTEATGRFIVSIFRSDMRQAGRDIVDIIGEILDKR